MRLSRSHPVPNLWKKRKLNKGAFKDHFSDDSGRYARSRPDYPPALFAWLASMSEGRRLALDVGCGTGQAARGLAPHFAHITAIDPSEAQIRAAHGPDNIIFRVAPAEDTGAPDKCVDLILAAQALHWFDHHRFYAEARRVAKDGALLAAIAYDMSSTSPEIDRLIAHLYKDITGPFWPPERRYFDDGYAQTIPFPFARLPTPAFTIRRRWQASDMLEFLRSWSGVRRYGEATGQDPVAMIEQEMRDLWGDDAREVVWPVILMIARLPPA